MAKGNCEFKGAGGQYFVTVFIHLFILGSLTLGIYTPWALVRLWRLKASHCRMNDQTVTFAGNGGELLVLCVVQGLLTLVTFGLYGPWALCKILHWKCRHTLIQGKPSTFSGTGGAFFLFYLIHLMLLPLVTLGLYYLYGVYRFYAWKEEHTRYGGQKTSFGATFGGFIKVSLIGWILNSVTLGLFTPWSMAMLYHWQIEGLSVGDTAEVSHFPPVKTHVLALAAVVLAGLLFLTGIVYLGVQMVTQYGGHVRTLTQLGGGQKKTVTRTRIKRPAARRISPKTKPALKTLSPAVASIPKPSQSRAASKKKTLNAAEELVKLDEWIRKDAENADAYYNRAWLFGEQGQLEKALDDYSMAIELNDRFADAYHNRGLIHVRLKKLDLALEDFSTAIKLDPSSADTYCNRGNVHFRLGMRDLGVNDYTQALKLNPNDADIYFNRGTALLASGQEPKAFADFKKAADLGHAKAKARLKKPGAAEKPAAEGKARAGTQ